jgi:DNA-directed RNA polymerase subunit RPC12/RpoP
MSEFFARFPSYRAEGMTPGFTTCKECGHKDVLILNAAVIQPDEVEMDCARCGSRPTSFRAF